MRRLLRVLVSIRTSAVLMLLLALLLGASVVVPQPKIGAIASSPLFVTILALFYVNLVAVLVNRLPQTLSRVRIRVPDAEVVSKWTSSPRAIERRSVTDAVNVVATLRGFGYRPHRVTPRALYAVKHRYAAIGFLLFHLSFLFLCAGGLLIWYTRFVGEMRLVEGQSGMAREARVLRSAPTGRIPDFGFTLEKMAPVFERGEATDLRGSFRLTNGRRADAWVNHPVDEGPVSLLVSDIGIAPVFWLQDTRGFGVDRVAAPSNRSEPIDVPLAAGVVNVRVVPRKEREFPSREALRSIPIDVIVREGGKEAFRGTLRPGDAAPLPSGRLVLTEVRYWGGVRIVSERGGLALIAGFVLATLGLTWRLLLHRRDLVIAWDERSFRIAGHGEWFAERDRRELIEIADSVGEAPRPSLQEIEVNA